MDVAEFQGFVTLKMLLRRQVLGMGHIRCLQLLPICGYNSSFVWASAQVQVGEE